MLQIGLRSTADQGAWQRAKHREAEGAKGRINGAALIPGSPPLCSAAYRAPMAAQSVPRASIASANIRSTMRTRSGFSAAMS